MANHVWKVMRALTGVDSGSDCRCCGESIQRDDRFGRSTAWAVRAAVAEALCDPDERDDPPRRFGPLGR
jgi:hypothetical protein